MPDGQRGTHLRRLQGIVCPARIRQWAVSQNTRLDRNFPEYVTLWDASNYETGFSQIKLVPLSIGRSGLSRTIKRHPEHVNFPSIL